MHLTASQASAIIKVADLPVYGIYKSEQLIKFIACENGTSYYKGIDMQTNADTEMMITGDNLTLYSSIDEAVNSMQSTVLQNRSVYTNRLAFYNYLESNYPESFV